MNNHRTTFLRFFFSLLCNTLWNVIHFHSSQRCNVHDDFSIHAQSIRICNDSYDKPIYSSTINWIVSNFTAKEWRLSVWYLFIYSNILYTFVGQFFFTIFDFAINQLLTVFTVTLNNSQLASPMSILGSKVI